MRTFPIITKIIKFITHLDTLVVSLFPLISQRFTSHTEFAQNQGQRILQRTTHYSSGENDTHYPRRSIEEALSSVQFHNLLADSTRDHELLRKEDVIYNWCLPTALFFDKYEAYVPLFPRPMFPLLVKTPFSVANYSGATIHGWSILPHSSDFQFSFVDVSWDEASMKMAGETKRPSQSKHFLMKTLCVGHATDGAGKLFNGGSYYKVFNSNKVREGRKICNKELWTLLVFLWNAARLKSSLVSISIKNYHD